MRFLLSALVVLATLLAALPADTQPPPNPCAVGSPLITIPEINRTAGPPGQAGWLRGAIVLSDEPRNLAGAASGTPCDKPQLRYLKGYSAAEPTKPWPSTGDPLPGPTLRARVGDLVELAFLNQVDTRKFPNTLDQGETGKTPGCDQATAQRQRKGLQDKSVQIYPRNDSFPDCLHGSSTANLHFHGTHTTPSTTGDNVLLFIRPALRQGGALEPPDDFVKQQFAEFYKWCEANGSPTSWEQMPPDWQKKQKELLQKYDSTAPYKGVNGALPEDMKLWPRNEAQLKQGLWPQYNVGAFPHCFRLPVYDPAKVKMGQAPGTHWYHAHKHGSTALNVGNGMTGAFVIEGAYDDELRKFYKQGLQEQVLVIQQLASGLNLLSASGGGSPAPLSVNGRLAPVLTMRPNEVQLWRIVNSAPRTFVQFVAAPQTTRGQDRATVSWRQIAQDGVQFAFENYERIGTVNASFNLAAANRADLLVRAPAATGSYNIQVVQSISDLPTGTAATLLTVKVAGAAVDPPQDFIVKREDFPVLPPFLNDITDPIVQTRYLTFDTKPYSGRDNVSKVLGDRPTGKGVMPVHEINGKLYSDHTVDQTMILNTTEEWKVSNKTPNIAHPFHIHINPFQITEIFQPNTAEAKDPNNPCYADPLKPSTWKPCHQLTGPFVWWDVFAIPTARMEDITSTCSQLDKCPADVRPYTICTKFPPNFSTVQCKVAIPGYFKFKSRFVDFTGQYVLHCHILAHEDRGMMELVQVIPKPVSPYSHH